jgi:NAD(P)-dependent dehydrogenase (short-subunit alcohol dehydrogenase family)
MTAACRRFEGKVAIVTGGASGIGAACARRLAAEGASVAIADVDESRGSALARDLGPDCAVVVHCDVVREADWRRLRDVVLERFGRLDTLHSNAFLQIPAAAHELEAEDWDRMLAVNLKAAYLGTKVLVDLLAASRGSIVLTSSVNAFIGRPGRPAYAASKAGLAALGRQLAVEYGPEVRVNTIVPGAILTPAWDAVPEEARRASEQGTAAKRLGRSDEVAAAVAFLASDQARHITGAALLIDGGQTLRRWISAPDLAPLSGKSVID